ncbi:hypothetical protein [Desulfopila sp. IMCC35008]|nr:hypothetical protein [Desulfopila sp. IMCC35008]
MKSYKRLLLIQMAKREPALFPHWEKPTHHGRVGQIEENQCVNDDVTQL